MENNKKKKQPKKGVRKSIKFYDELRLPFPHKKRNYK